MARNASRMPRALSAVMVLLATSTASAQQPARQLDCGDLVRDSVAEGEQDVFTFTGDAGDTVTITLVKEGGVSTFTPVFDLSGPAPDLKPIAKEKFGLQDVQLPEKGEYTVTVKPRGILDFYFLSLVWLAPLEKQCFSNGINYGDTAQGVLGDGVEEIYNFLGAAGDAIEIDLAKTDGDTLFSPEFDLFGPGTERTPLATGTEGRSKVELGEDGMYTLRVHQNYRIDRNQGFFNLSGSYSVTLSRVNPPLFVRGDPNADGSTNVTDAIVLLRNQFLGAPAYLACEKSADFDDSGKLEITDAIVLLSYLFQGGDPPPVPFPDCGADTTADSLACDTYPYCE